MGIVLKIDNYVWILISHRITTEAHTREEALGPQQCILSMLKGHGRHGITNFVNQLLSSGRVNCDCSRVCLVLPTTQPPPSSTLFKNYLTSLNPLQIIPHIMNMENMFSWKNNLLHTYFSCFYLATRFWLSWNSWQRLGWPQTAVIRSPLPMSAGITGLPHYAWISLQLLLHQNRQLQARVCLSLLFSNL